MIRSRQCRHCGKHAAHSIGREWECCECYVRAGHAPSDWHPVCMETKAKMREEKERLTSEDAAVFIAPLPSTPESLATAKYIIESYLRHRRETEPDAKLVEFYTPPDKKAEP